MADEQMNPVPHRKRGPKPKNPPKPQRKAGGYGGVDGARKYPDNALEGVRKPVAEMTPDERRIYQAQVQRVYRARRKTKTVPAAQPFAPPVPPVEPVAILALATPKQRVKAQTDAEAQAVAGNNAVAVLDAKVILPRSLWARTRAVAAHIRSSGIPEADASALIETVLEPFISAYEARYNEGQPFDEADAGPTPRNPVPRAQKPKEK